MGGVGEHLGVCSRFTCTSYHQNLANDRREQQMCVRTVYVCVWYLYVHEIKSAQNLWQASDDGPVARRVVV